MRAGADRVRNRRWSREVAQKTLPLILKRIENKQESKS